MATINGGRMHIMVTTIGAGMHIRKKRIGLGRGFRSNIYDEAFWMASIKKTMGAV